MISPICVKCNRIMTREECGVLVVELYMDDRKIYKLWFADLFRCTVCRTEVVHDFAEKPFWQSHEKNRDGQRDVAIATARGDGKLYEIKERG